MDQQARKITEGFPASEGSKAALDADANSSQIQSDDTSVGSLQCYSKTHKFWETQPVVQYKDIGDMSLPEGPIDPATLVSEVKPEPYNLPGQFEWTTCDMKSDDTCAEVYKFFKENYPDDGYQFMVEYSREFLRWALCPPGYHQSWHIGVRVKTSKKHCNLPTEVSSLANGFASTVCFDFSSLEPG